VYLAGYYATETGFPWTLNRNTYNYNDTFTWVKGKHTIKWGAQVSRYQLHQLFEFYSDGLGYFLGGYTGDASADFLMGDTAIWLQESPGRDDLRQTLWGFFGEDSIKLKPRLTVTLGLRYDPYLGFRELNGESVAVRPGEQSTVYPTAPLGLVFEGDQNVNNHFFKPDWHSFGPRFGFAWDVFGDHKTAVRGGFGIFHDSIQGIGLNLFTTAQPFVLAVEEFGSDANPLKLDNPYASYAVSPFPYSPPATPAQKAAYHFVTPAGEANAHQDMTSPYTQQWNLTVERQLPSQFVVSGAYVGSRSEKLFYQSDLNPGVKGVRLLPQFGAISDMQTDGFSNYNSLQLLVKRPMYRNLTLMSAYTYSKSMGLGYEQSSANLGSNFRDPVFDNDLDYSPVNYDVTHVLSLSAVGDLPTFRQHSAIVRNVLGGWETTGILQAQTGFPFTVRSGANNSGNLEDLETANPVPGQVPSLTQGSRGQKIQKWFNTAAFQLNPAGTVGLVGVNTMRGPGFWNLDFGMFKNFRITERFQLQYRAEFFNIFNNVNLNAPNSTVASGAAFGTITSTGTPRYIEMALKLRF